MDEQSRFNDYLRDRRLDRDLEKEPHQRRQRIPLRTDGAVKQWWAQRQQMPKVKP
jgi:hypothetical protein